MVADETNFTWDNLSETSLNLGQTGYAPGPEHVVIVDVLTMVGTKDQIPLISGIVTMGLYSNTPILV